MSLVKPSTLVVIGPKGVALSVIEKQLLVVVQEPEYFEKEQIEVVRCHNVESLSEIVVVKYFISDDQSCSELLSNFQSCSKLIILDSKDQEIFKTVKTFVEKHVRPMNA